MNDMSTAGACPQCGKAVRPGLLFCEGCGARLTGAAPSGPPVAGSAVSGATFTAPIAQSSPPVVAPPVMAPPMVAAPAYAAPMPYAQQSVVVHHVGGVGNNGLCVAALVLGIIAIVFMFIPFINFIGLVLAVLAVIFGAIGIPSSGKKGQSGKGMGIAGLVLGLISVGMTLIFIFVVYAALLGIASSGY